MKFIRAFLTCRDAAKANRLSGWFGLVVAAGAGWLVSSGYLMQAREWVCTASADDLGLAVALIGGGASLINSGATKALTPKPDTIEPMPDAIKPASEYPRGKNGR
jgi:predicted phage tail protein